MEKLEHEFTEISVTGTWISGRSHEKHDGNCIFWVSTDCMTPLPPQSVPSLPNLETSFVVLKNALPCAFFFGTFLTIKESKILIF